MQYNIICIGAEQLCCAYIRPLFTGLYFLILLVVFKKKKNSIYRLYNNRINAVKYYRPAQNSQIVAVSTVSTKIATVCSSIW